MTIEQSSPSNVSPMLFVDLRDARDCKLLARVYPHTRVVESRIQGVTWRLDLDSGELTVIMGKVARVVQITDVIALKND